MIANIDKKETLLGTARHLGHRIVLDETSSIVTHYGCAALQRKQKI
jgi:hypothetical protein